MKPAIVFLFLLISHPGIIRHDTDIAKYRALGNSADFNSVGRYSSTISSNDYATGVLISETWVLTASHFIGDSSVWMFGDTYYKSRRIVRHPNLKPGASEMQWTGWDLALVELTTPVKNVAPAKRYYGRSELNATISKIGYGYVGDGIIGMKKPHASERLGGQNIIDAVGGTFESRTFTTDVLVFDFDSPDSISTNKFGSPVPLELEIGGSKGDSGGGVFAKFDGEWKLVGIVSGALNREMKYGAVAALARVSSANYWIDSVIKS
jgi:Trypsin